MSTSSRSSNGNKKKTKKQITPLGLEEVFNSLSLVTSSNLNPPPGKVVLTPRSAEVCLKLGINPEVLKIRDIDSFWESGIDPAVQRIRHEAYVQRRYDTMRQCRLEKKRMSIAEFDASTNLNDTSHEAMTPEMILEEQKKQTSTLIEMEMKRIEKMKFRQQKELESMVEFEVNRAKIQQEMQQKIAAQKKKDEMRKKQAEKRVRMMAEERRLRELQKAAQEEAEEENRKAVAHRMHLQEQELLREKEERAKEEKKRMREKEEEKIRAHEEHRRKTEQFFEEEQMKLRQRLENLNDADRKKQELIIARQKAAQEEVRKRREEAEKRIAKNMEMAELIEKRKKEQFLEKQAHHEQLREEALRQQEEERRLHAQEIELQEQRRHMILLQQRREEERAANNLLTKFEQDEIHVAEIQAMRDKEHEIHNERKKLRAQMKLENVERVKRMKEYQRMGTLKKIEDTSGRVESMLQQKEALKKERKIASINTKRQKESIAKVMEEVRTNASKASKIISMALTGKVSLEALTQQSSGKKKKRAKSATNKHSKTSPEKLGLGDDRESRSAGAHGGGGGTGKKEYDDDMARGMEASEKLDKVYGAAPGALSPPKAYVSPYDAENAYEDDFNN